MLSHHKLSIVIPNYNYGVFLRELINSINTLKNRGLVQIIVVDACSTDSSAEVINDCLMSHDLYIIEKDRGQADAVSKGLNLASGTWFMFQNSDDLFHIETLDWFLDNLSLSETYEVVAFDQGFLVEDIHGFRPIKSFTHSGQFFYPLFLKNIYFTNQSTIYRTNLAKSVDFDFRFQFCLDLDFTVRYFKLFKPRIVYFNEILGFQRLHDLSKTSNMQERCIEESSRIRLLNFSIYDRILLYPILLFYYLRKFSLRICNLRNFHV